MDPLYRAKHNRVNPSVVGIRVGFRPSFEEVLYDGLEDFDLAPVRDVALRLEAIEKIFVLLKLRSAVLLEELRMTRTIYDLHGAELAYREPRPEFEKDRRSEISPIRDTHRHKAETLIDRLGDKARRAKIEHSRN